MDDYQFAQAEEHRWSTEEEEFLNDMEADERAEFEAFMAEEAEHDDYCNALTASLEVSSDLHGVATADEIEDLCEKYGVTI